MRENQQAREVFSCAEPLLIPLISVQPNLIVAEEIVLRRPCLAAHRALLKDPSRPTVDHLPDCSHSSLAANRNSANAALQEFKARASLE